MQHKTFFKLFVTVLSITLFFAYCKKGDTGPAGPAGTTGPTGQTGATGAKGDTGTANVIYSAWLDVAYTADTFRAAGNVLDTNGFYTNIAVPKLSNAILTSGEIKVYLNANTAATPVIFPLPYYNVYTDYSIIPQFSLQRIFIYSDGNPSTFTNTSGAKVNQYRYVLIPGAVPGVAAPPVDWNNYSKVKEYLGLTN